MKGATRILSAEEHSHIEQEQLLNKQLDTTTQMAMDTTNHTPTTTITQNSHAGVPGAGAGGSTLECCNKSNNGHINPSGAAVTTTTMATHNNPHQQQNQNTTNMLYMPSPPSTNTEINSSSSSYNIQTSSSTMSNSNNTTTLAPQPIVVPSSTATGAVAANVMSNHHLSQQQIQYDSPQIQPYDIKSLFECPICFDYAVPPIYQCQNGHLVCQTCSHKIAHCPTCRVPITEPAIRNLQLDKLANQFQFPCKYNFVGCQWKSYSFKKREHEEVCDYISYSCPCPGTSCKWTGLLSQVMPHLSEHHKSITTLRGEDIVFLATDINLKGAVDWVMIQSCFRRHFLLVLEKQELKNGQQQFFAIVQLIGTPKEAEKFKYKLELSSNAAGQTKRLQWEATPRSILDGVQFAIANYDCLVFDSRMAQHFLSPIKRDNQNKPDSCTSDNNNQGGAHSENLGINVTIERVM